MTEQNADEPYAPPAEPVPDAVTPTEAAFFATAAARLPLPLTLEFRLTPEERKEGEKETGTLARTLAMLTLVLFLLASAVLMFGSMYWFIPADQLWIVGVITGMVVIGLMLQNRFQRWKKKETEEESPGLLACEVDSTGLLFREDTSETFISPDACRDIRESDHLYLLQLDGITLMIPKRVFETEEQANAFFALIKTWSAPAESNNGGSATAPDEVRIVVTRQLSDTVDRVLTSWRARGFVLCMLAMTLFVILLPPNESATERVHSHLEAALIMMGIILIAAPVLGFLFFFVGACWSVFLVQPKGEFFLSDEGIRNPQPTGHSLQNWSTPTRYKESRRSFYLWWPGTHSWMVLPKRDFDSPEDEQRCRQLLAEHSKQTTWFWG